MFIDDISTLAADLSLEPESEHLRLVASIAKLTLDCDPSTVMPQILSRLARSTGCAVVGHLGIRRREISAVRLIGADLAVGTPLSDLPWCTEAIETGAPVRVLEGDPRQDLDGEEADTLGLRTAVVVPVVDDHGTTGVLIAGGHGTGTDPLLAPLLEATASVLGAAASRERMVATQHRLLITDPDTGLMNAAGMLPWLDPANASGLPRDVVLVRVRAVDDIQTAYGARQARSFVLACATTLQRAFDVPVARTGVNELGMVVEDAATPRALAEEVSRVLAAPISGGEGLHALADAAIGVTRARSGIAPVTLVGEARSALADAARHQSRPISVYQGRFITDTAAALAQALALEEAVREGQLSIHVQPARRFTERAPTFAEILVRFDSPELVGVPVGDLIANAERSGAVSRLGTQVMRHAAALDLRLRRTGMALDLLSINLSVMQVQEESVVDDLTTTVAAADGAPANFGVELTESAAMSDAAVAVLHALHDQGFSIIIDDFGAGTVPTHRLLDLPFDVLKVDRSLLRGVEEDAARRTVMASTIKLGLDLDKVVIVGGVETDAQASMVRDMGADLAQGYRFARPEPPELGVLELTDWGIWSP